MKANAQPHFAKGLMVLNWGEGAGDLFLLTLWWHGAEGNSGDKFFFIFFSTYVQD